MTRKLANLRPNKYGISKLCYILLLEFALIADLILALSGYEWLKTVIGDVASLAILALVASSVLGVSLYLLDRWQLEHLTKRR